ncbi:hypothetical protein JOM56_001718 [Amanita muscaria]
MTYNGTKKDRYIAVDYSTSPTSERSLNRGDDQRKLNAQYVCKALLSAVAFLDVEAAESSDDEEYDIEEEEEGDVLDKEADLLEYIDLTESDSSSSSLAHGPSGVRGLKAVIARYEDRRPCTPSDPWGDDSQEEEVEEPLLPIQLQQAARLPPGKILVNPGKVLVLLGTLYEVFVSVYMNEDDKKDHVHHSSMVLNWP